MSKSRVFQFTQFDFDESTDETYRKLIGNSIGYIAYGLETCPSTGKLHRQGWVYYRSQRQTSKSSLKKLSRNFNNAHMEPLRGSLAQNDIYCSKEGKLVEFGVRPKQGDRNDLKDVVARIQTGDTTTDEICIDDPGFYHMYGRTLQKAEDIILRKKYRTEMTKGIWYYGGTGVGKSHIAFDGFTPETHYDKPLQDEWWDGYTGQKTVILNEFRGQITFSEMLSLVDKWPHSVRRRNREPIPFLAEKLIVTSSLHPREVYSKACTGSDAYDQLTRRFDIWLINGDRSLVQQ